MILLDTSAVIELLEGGEFGKKVQGYIEDDVAGVSTITINEFLVGAGEKQKQTFQEFLKSSEILSFDELASYKSVGIEKSLSRKGEMIGKLDIFIAAICLVQDVPLITTDKDFKNVDGLKVFIIA